jgi:hypothetical protein
MKKCQICGSQNRHVFRNQLLHKYDVAYFQCDTCGLLQTEHPYWLQEAYADAIANADTGLVQRNVRLSRQIAVLLYLIFGKEGRYADLAGGTGLLVRMMRDVGFDFYWHDPYCRNVHARGFEFNPELGPCNATTAFEVLEHLEDPVRFIADAIEKAKTDTFIFSTELFNGVAPAPGQWWYYSPETGQHISFYQHRTLKMIADQLGMQYYSSGGLHLMTRRQISAPLYRLAVRRVSAVIFPFVQHCMKGKTMSDHQQLLRTD